MPAFTYFNNIPQPTDQLSTSQPDLLTNFASIQGLIDIDHVDFASADAGKHAKVTFPVQAVAPTFAAGEFGLYNKSDGLNNQLNLVNPNALVGLVSITSTNSFNIVTSAPAPGYAFFPNGYLIKWGPLSAIPATSATVINFPTFDSGGNAIPAFVTGCGGALVGNISAGTPNQVLSVQAVTKTTLTVYNSGTIASGFFIAFGV